MFIRAQQSRYNDEEHTARASRIRTVRITGGDYPVASIVRLRVEQALYGRGERIWPPARRLRWRSRKKCDLFLLCRRRSAASSPLDGLLDFYIMVGARGFEPPTSCSQSRRATGLRYAPTARHLCILGETTSRSTNPFIQECFDRCPGNA